MAAPTEAEQQKTNQSLQNLEKKEDDTLLSLGKITSILKEGNALAVLQHDESAADEETRQKIAQDILGRHKKSIDKGNEIAQAAKDEEKAAEAKKKAEKEGEKTARKTGEKRRGAWFEATGNWFSQLKKHAEDENYLSNQKFKFEGGFFTRQLKWMRIIQMDGKETKAYQAHQKKLAKEGNRFQRMSYNMAVRSAKLALRGGKAVKDWGVKGLTKMKDKAFDWIKSLGKLLLLLGIWGAAMWADANMLKEDWEALKVKLNAWKDKLIEWWSSLDGALDTVMSWWNSIKSWFQDTFGAELKAWHVALAAFGLWLIGPKLLFMGTFALAKGAFWGMKKLLGMFYKGSVDDLPDTRGIDADKKKARKGARKKVRWWKRMFGLGGQQSNFYDEMGKKALGIETKQPSMMDKVRKSFSNFGKRLSNLFSKVIPDKLGSIGTSIKETTGNWMKSATDSVKAGWSKVKDVGGKLGTSIMDGIKSIGSKISNAGAAVKDVLTKSPALNKVGNVLKMGGKVGLKAFAKLAVPFEAIRGSVAGFKKQGPNDMRTMSERMSDASSGLVKSVTDFMVVDMLKLGGDIEGWIRNKDAKDTLLGGGAEKLQELSDKKFGKWKKGTKMMDGSFNPFALTLEQSDEVNAKRAEKRKIREDFNALGGLGLTKQVQMKGRAGVGGRTKTAFDVEGFQKLLVAISGDNNFATMAHSITTLQKAGQITAADAEKYKMQISKEQKAGTAPTVNQITNYTNHTGNTSMVMSSKVDNSEYVTLQNY